MHANSLARETQTGIKKEKLLALCRRVLMKSFVKSGLDKCTTRRIRAAFGVGGIKSTA